MLINRIESASIMIYISLFEFRPVVISIFRCVLEFDSPSSFRFSTHYTVEWPSRSDVSWSPPEKESENWDELWSQLGRNSVKGGSWEDLSANTCSYEEHWMNWRVMKMTWKGSGKSYYCDLWLTFIDSLFSLASEVPQPLKRLFIF